MSMRLLGSGVGKAWGPAPKLAPHLGPEERPGGGDLVYSGEPRGLFPYFWSPIWSNLSPEGELIFSTLALRQVLPPLLPALPSAKSSSLTFAQLPANMPDADGNVPEWGYCICFYFDSEIERESSRARNQKRSEHQPLVCTPFGGI